MGQEIVYCYWCSSRILGADFDKGAAILIGNHACCPQCLPKVLASLPAAQRETLLGELSKHAASPPPTRNTPRGGTNISSTRTPRAMPQIPAEEPRKPPILAVAIGIGAVALVALLAVVFTSGKPEPVARKELPPAVDRVPPPQETPDREKTARAAIDKARDGMRSGLDIDLQVRLWEEAVEKSQRSVLLREATGERDAIVTRRREVYAAELAKLGETADAAVREGDFKKAADLLAAARNRHGLPEWGQGVERKSAEVRKAEAENIPYRQGNDPDGLVCVEAERCHGRTDRAEHAWTLVTAPAGFQGAGAMACLPNSNLGFPTEWGTLAPRMDYRIQFVKPGKYFVWIRGWAKDGSDDSIHAGLDGAETLTSAAMLVPIAKGWGWSTRTMTSGSATFEVKTPGLHTLNVWMREDGAVIDRIVITTNAKYVPKDAGPHETPR